MGAPFAPSWGILRPALEARIQALGLRHDTHEARRMLDAAWAAYGPAYTAEMRDSYRVHRGAWDALLALPRVVLLCYCVEPERCHRSLFAAILWKFGAEVRGEIRSQQVRLFT